MAFAAKDEKGFVIVKPNEIVYEKNPAGSGPDIAVIAGDPTKEDGKSHMFPVYGGLKFY